MVEIVTTDEFRVWYTELDDDTAEDVTVSVDYLAVEGLRLGYPRSSAITGASFALRDLRIQSKVALSASSTRSTRFATLS